MLTVGRASVSGNDIVVIVFLEAGFFVPPPIASKLTMVYLVVQPVRRRAAPAQTSTSLSTRARARFVVLVGRRRSPIQ